jgi:lysophospholipase L1-like esterase
MMRKLLLLAASLLVATVIAEVLLRMLTPDEQHYVFPASKMYFLEPDAAVVKGVSKKVVFKTNPQGLRGMENFAAAERKLFFTGGSTVECLYLNESWPHLVWKNLQTTNNAYASAGKSGADATDNYYHLLYAASQHKPDYVFVMTGLNDMLKCLSKGAPLLRYTDTKPEVDILRATFLVYGRKHEKNLFRRTALGHLLTQQYIRLRNPPPKAYIQDKRAHSYIQWRKHREEASIIIDTLPNILHTDTARFGKLLSAMALWAKKHSCRIVFVEHPAVWAADLPEHVLKTLWMGGVGNYLEHGGSAYYSPRVLREALDMYNHQVQKVATLHDATYVPLDEVSRNPLCFYDDCHLTEYGAEQVAKQVVKHIRR